MTPERWRQITAIFHAALAREEADRAAFVVASCGDDVAVRREIEAMLAAHHNVDRIGETPLLPPGTGETELNALSSPAYSAMSLPVGTTLGPYEILTLAGAGGMGEVYRARDTRLDRTVAIKVLRAQSRVTLEAHRRFEREARAVSRLNHPHIWVCWLQRSSES